jgi:quercetin dioxygenase-like cupin family protein
MQDPFFPKDSFPNKELDSNGLSRRLIAFGGGLMLAEMSFESGSVSAVHAHQEEQLSYCLSGRFEAEVGGMRRILEPGDSFYAGPGQGHGALCLETGKLLHVFTPQREDYK